MASFAPGAAPGSDALGMSAPGSGLGIEPFDDDLGFDNALLDSAANGLPPLPFTPSYDFETFSTTFEDPFSFSVTGAGRFDAAVAIQDAEPFNEESSSPQEPDNKLLGFSDPVLKASLVDDAGNFADIKMSAELYGMFFVAEDVFGAAETANPARPPELTCYRRNLFQCAGQVSLPRTISHGVTEDGSQVPIVEVAASLTASESIDGRAAEIISIPWKSSNPAPAGSGADDGTKTAGAPPMVPLDLGSAQEEPSVNGGGGRVTLPVAWKRLQFKHATANNGRRKGLQQHYVVQISLLGKTSTGDFIPIAEIRSGPVIVRGRSPRNFDSSKDVPLSGNEKKLERRSTNESVGSTAQQQKATADRGELPSGLPRYNSAGSIPPSDWSAAQQPFNQTGQPATKKVALSPTVTRPPVPAWASDSSTYSQSKASLNSAAAAPLGAASMLPSGTPSMPINLSLSEDERSPNRPAGDTSPRQSKSLSIAVGHNPDGSPLEDADLLYEYFPLSLDDWMPPVDAIYRPHVVHHVTPDFKAQQVRSKTKRYFAAD